MSVPDEDGEALAHLLESEILSVNSSVEVGRSISQGEAEGSSPPPSKRPRLEEEEEAAAWVKATPAQMETESFSKIPPELLHHILRLFSSEDLVSCSLVCKCLNTVASDECLWRRLYYIRWGFDFDSPLGKLRVCAWKKLYIQRDQEEMAKLIGNVSSEFKEYYIQMHTARRSQAPLASQVNDDCVILDRTVADQLSIWKSTRGLTDEVVTDHVCSGETCSYLQIGDVFFCEKTGCVHVCDGTCREVVLDELNGHFVCTISGHVFDKWLSSDNETDAEQQEDIMDEADPYTRLGRFGDEQGSPSSQQSNFYGG